MYTQINTDYGNKLWKKQAKILEKLQGVLGSTKRHMGSSMKRINK